ncbi:MAG: Hsp20/alpha crystallin family protein [Thermoproteota archaeon]|nr:Hsp20/alpha crystallin family protein [Thermoproteota archaeon]
MCNCDIDSYDWFRIFNSRCFGAEFSRDFEEAEREFEDTFMEIETKASKELMGEYETSEGPKVREIGQFVYGYSMAIGFDGTPRVTEFSNAPSGIVSTGSSRGRKGGVSNYDRTEIMSEREPLADINVYDKEVKVVVEMPGLSKEHIKIQAYNNSVEVSTDYPQRKYQIIDIPSDADIETVKSTYKNGILEIVFKKKRKLKRNNNGRK